MKLLIVKFMRVKLELETLTLVNYKLRDTDGLKRKRKIKLI